MAVGLIWSFTNGGDAIVDIVDHGNASNGANTASQVIYIRHDGVNPITNTGLYIRQYSGSYTGAATAVDDYQELLSWGDATVAADFGGFEVSFNGSTWPSVSSKSPSNAFVARTGTGDNETNAVTLPTATGADVAGEIQASETDVNFTCRIVVPTNEDTVGLRQFDQVLRYTFTS